jgi:molybdopterin-containing oxidoreductase family iron-sulfur binding subunit
MAKYGMVINLKRCVGCNACTIACRGENGTDPGIKWCWVEDREIGEYPNVKRVFLPLLCMHCEEPSCLTVCPTGATYKDENSVVLVDYDKCIGCKSCILACPYKARYFRKKEISYFEGIETPYERIKKKKHSVGVVEKCDFCVDRIKNGAEPSCVQTCMTKARIFGDLDDVDSEVFQTLNKRSCISLLKELGTNPKVFYILP